MSGGLLSICIPTYNRKCSLEKTLNSIAGDASELNINIIISDNDSQDGTEEVVSEFVAKFENIRYSRNSSNIGIDRNMLKSAEMADTDYVYMLGDDDCLSEGALFRLYDLLRDKAHDLILINQAQICNGGKVRKQMTVEGDDVFFDAKAFFKRHVFDMPFGSFIVKREALQVSNYERFFDTYHAYSGLVWDYLADKMNRNGRCSVLVISDSLVSSQNVAKSWSDNSIKIHLDRIPKWFTLIDKYYEPHIANVENAYMREHACLYGLLEYACAAKKLFSLPELKASRRYLYYFLVSLRPFGLRIIHKNIIRKIYKYRKS